jgi:hypothetical protein
MKVEKIDTFDNDGALMLIQTQGTLSCPLFEYHIRDVSEYNLQLNDPERLRSLLAC